MVLGIHIVCLRVTNLEPYSHCTIATTTTTSTTTAECSKTARAVKSHTENLDARKEKDEARAEMKRLQALKENDMEAYSNLVQDTKNGRLKFLLNETDSYISTINRMIQEQRVLTVEEIEAASKASIAGAEGASGSAGAMEEGEGSPRGGELHCWLY